MPYNTKQNDHSAMQQSNARHDNILVECLLAIQKF